MNKIESDKAFKEIGRGINKGIKVLKIVIPVVIALGLGAFGCLIWVVCHFVGKLW